MFGWFKLVKNSIVTDVNGFLANLTYIG